MAIVLNADTTCPIGLERGDYLVVFAVAEAVSLVTITVLVAQVEIVVDFDRLRDYPKD